MLKNDASALATRLQEVSTERQFLHMADHLQLLAKISVDKETYSEGALSQEDATVKREYMGVGSGKTWHGAPDGRASWTSLSIYNPSESDSADSDLGGGASLEAEQLFAVGHVDQLLAHAVVMSHTHHNRHPEQYPVVPAVGLGGVEGEMMAVVYDCVADVKIQIPPICWIDVMRNAMWNLECLFSGC